MAKNVEHVQHVKSSVVLENEGIKTPKLPNPSALTEGEIAVNFAAGYETISIVNSSGEVSTFVSLWDRGTGENAIVQKGGNNNAVGKYSVAEGYNTAASGNYGSHAEGSNTIASGYSSHAEGSSTTASSDSSHAEGIITQANGKSSHAEGSITKAYGDYSHVEGRESIASGDSSHAEGYYTRANGGSSHAEGSWTVANGDTSHAEGGSSKANGEYSHAEGDSTTANGRYSHAEGHYTEAKNQSEHASGQYNVSSSGSSEFGNSGNTLFSVGNGSADNARHNAFEIRQNGDIYIVSGGTDIKLQDNLGGNITVDQVLDNTTSASTNPVATKAVYDVIVDNEYVWGNAFGALSGAVSSHTENTNIHVTAADKANWNAKLDSSDIEDFFDDAKYEMSGTTHVINFYNGNTVKATINAEDFIVDGMVESVSAFTSGSTTVLDIKWNTAAGGQESIIDIGDIFEADNYYQKSETSGATEISTALNAKLDTTAYTPVTIDQTIDSGTSASTNAVSTSAVYNALLNSKEIEISSGVTPIGDDIEIWIDESEDPYEVDNFRSSSAVTAMTGYAIASSGSSISTTDTLNEAIAKLEKRIADLEALIAQKEDTQTIRQVPGKDYYEIV